MAYGKCTFGTRPNFDQKLLHNYIYLEVKHYRNYTTYTPNYRAVPLTTKFYAAHDLLKESEEQKKKVEEYTDKIANLRARGPHNKYSAPVTTNHEYGWHLNPLTLKRNDSPYRKGRVRILK